MSLSNTSPHSYHAISVGSMAAPSAPAAGAATPPGAAHAASAPKPTAAVERRKKFRRDRWDMAFLSIVHVDRNAPRRTTRPFLQSISEVRYCTPNRRKRKSRRATVSLSAVTSVFARTRPSATCRLLRASGWPGTYRHACRGFTIQRKSVAQSSRHPVRLTEKSVSDRVAGRAAHLTPSSKTRAILPAKRRKRSLGVVEDNQNNLLPASAS